ncbi:translation initiation factor IF-2-like [Condylostylus longicornis]|uniref:translation initiation factor IF-2-like n=1 Tax=Condylostylus longicornis TaxID=2530218 RepID=UPI00244E52BE|nr:translation initiation factor IF-2-like [Condylostylus longicornis]
MTVCLQAQQTLRFPPEWQKMRDIELSGAPPPQATTRFLKVTSLDHELLNADNSEATGLQPTSVGKPTIPAKPAIPGSKLSVPDGAKAGAKPDLKSPTAVKPTAKPGAKPGLPSPTAPKPVEPSGAKPGAPSSAKAGSPSAKLGPPGATPASPSGAKLEP